MAGFDDWIEVFKTGLHTDASGKTRNWTTQDLDTIETKYSAPNHEAPAVIGHPDDNKRAYGWVEGLKRTGEKLFAKFKQMEPNFVEAVKSGAFKKRSIAVYPDLTLKHIGFLGAVPPAVKGLADITFAGEPGTATEYAFEFSAPPVDPSRANKEEQDMPPEKTTEIEATVAKITEDLKKKEEALQAATSRLKALEGEKASDKFAESLKEKDEALKAAMAKLEAVETEKASSEFSQFCEGLIREGKMMPAQVDPAKTLYVALRTNGEFEFADGTASLADKFKKFLVALPKSLDFNEFATKSAVNHSEPSDDAIKKSFLAGLNGGR